MNDVLRHLLPELNTKQIACTVVATIYIVSALTGLHIISKQLLTKHIVIVVVVNIIRPLGSTGEYYFN